MTGSFENKPEEAEGYTNQGNAKSKLGDHDGTIAGYDRAIELNPDDVIVYCNRRDAKSVLGDEGGASEDHIRAIGLDMRLRIAYW